ncbi:DUF397 domain-containing protein [Actinomadura spongiicola]|uniref:DUF397 domain-containing protein n=1 Tax=Actinomadura spongiicola TaxID=2303421 RepID=A0A372GIL3_9ACTN|nr:DUF397 domain-containing protein [Actinomadura spongiicola]RFS84949.1 DUF397 domain-containing protein [Actinomadura spongiicola]
MDTARTSKSVAWRTSTYTREGNCVQIAELEARVIGIRDSKDPDGPYLPLSQAVLATLLTQIKAGVLGL